MNIEELRDFCLSMPYTTEDTPFDETTLAFRIGNKIYGLTNIDSIPTRINLKCNPERAIELREKYPDAIVPGYHMSKKHWNTLYTENLDSGLIEELIRHSYDLVFNSLTKSKRVELGQIN
ncbi:MAG: MmcQ/YjbR family DNA-binding protein [Candidatus Kapaibacterium sp.]|nr:MmcQ/YjbR family DNA-binding protein [Ignavibacteriota bacterium]MCB9222016.1 MmcQ/YjbR family DNA-binding protein [Ignavibacteria bacterium]